MISHCSCGCHRSNTRGYQRPRLVQTDYLRKYDTSNVCEAGLVCGGETGDTPRRTSSTLNTQTTAGDGGMARVGGIGGTVGSTKRTTCEWPLFPLSICLADALPTRSYQPLLISDARLSVKRGRSLLHGSTGDGCNQKWLNPLWCHSG